MSAFDKDQVERAARELCQQMGGIEYDALPEVASYSFRRQHSDSTFLSKSEVRDIVDAILWVAVNGNAKRDDRRLRLASEAGRGGWLA